MVGQITMPMDAPFARCDKPSHVSSAERKEEIQLRLSDKHFVRVLDDAMYHLRKNAGPVIGQAKPGTTAATPSNLSGCLNAINKAPRPPSEYPVRKTFRTLAKAADKSIPEPDNLLRESEPQTKPNRRKTDEDVASIPGKPPVASPREYVAIDIGCLAGTREGNDHRFLAASQPALSDDFVGKRRCRGADNE